MDEIRKIPVKTLEDQKKFLNLRYPKTPPFKFKWKMLISIIIDMIIFIVIFQLISYIFNKLKINISMWLAILLVMILPILINIILEKFKLQKSDITVFLK